MAKERFTEGYFTNSVHTPHDNHHRFSQTDDSDSSGQLDTEITASEDSNVLLKRTKNLKTRYRSALNIPVQILSLSKASPSERRRLVLRLRSELEQIRLIQRQFELRTSNGHTLSSSSDILSCGNVHNNLPGYNGPTSHVFSFDQNKSSLRQNRDCGSNNLFPRVDELLSQGMMNATIMKQCDGLIKKLLSHQFGYMFNAPVDVVKFNIPDYFTVIKYPMDLGTVQSKLAAGSYSTPFEFLSDVRLTFSNALSYNPRGNRVCFMAESLSKFFETKWKAIEKKITTPKKQMTSRNLEARRENPMGKVNHAQRKRKFTSIESEDVPKPKEKIMTNEERLSLSKQLEGILGELPTQIVEFLKDNCSNARQTGEDEIEIDINDLSNDTLFELQKLIDSYLLEKKSFISARPCERELLNEQGLGKRSMPQYRENSVHDNAHNGETNIPVSSNLSETVKATNGKSSQCVSFGCSDGDSESTWGMDQPELISGPQQFQDEKLCRAALLKNRFADTIFNAREKTLTQGGKVDPDKLRKDKEALELLRKKERIRLQEEAKAAEEALRKAEAEAAAEAKKKRQLEREAARMALHQMEKTVEINEGGLFLEHLENLRSGTVGSGDKLSPGNSEGGLDHFGFTHSNNPLEQLGLYIKADQEEDPDAHTFDHPIINI